MQALCSHGRGLCPFEVPQNPTCSGRAMGNEFQIVVLAVVGPASLPDQSDRHSPPGVASAWCKSYPSPLSFLRALWGRSLSEKQFLQIPVQNGKVVDSPHSMRVVCLTKRKRGLGFATLPSGHFASQGQAVESNRQRQAITTQRSSSKRIKWLWPGKEPGVFKPRPPRGWQMVSYEYSNMAFFLEADLSCMTQGTFFLCPRIMGIAPGPAK